MGSRKMDVYKRLFKLIDNRKNYQNYRDAIAANQLPAFPYVGLYLKDLTFIEDGNDNFLDEGKTVINFEKMRMVAKVFKTIQMYQQNPYDFAVAPVLQTWLTKNKKVLWEDDKLYELSKIAEPSQLDRRE